MHQVELTIADSSTLLAAAVAAFQTGHTIEMTGAVLNTLSTVTDENGLTIISGEEVPVHTTVQYKCTICHQIFYEKQYIVAHLSEAHSFDIDISYFEELELQQQEQLQQKIYEQQQEQLMLQQQQQIDQQGGQVQVLGDSSKSMETGQQQEQHHHQQQGHAQIMTDESAVQTMMMMMNNNNVSQPTTLQPILLQNGTQAELVNSQIVASGDVLTLTPALPIPLIANIDIAHAKPTPPPKPQINYSCNYCTFGADKLKKMSEHLKNSHSFRDKTCMDNVRQQVIRLPNDDHYAPQTVNSLIQQQMNSPIPGLFYHIEIFLSENFEFNILNLIFLFKWLK